MSNFNIAIQFNYVLIRVNAAGLAELYAHMPIFGVNHTQIIEPGKQFVWQNNETFIAVQSIDAPEPIRCRLVISHHPRGMLLIEELHTPTSSLWSINPYQTNSPSTAVLQGNDHLLFLDWGDNQVIATALPKPQPPGAAEHGTRPQLSAYSSG